MKDLKDYIYESYSNTFFMNEGIISWLKAFVEKIKSNMQSRVNQNGSVDMLDMDLKKGKLQYQKEPIQLELVDRQTIKDWENVKIGFPSTAKLAKNLKKYTADNNGESDPYAYTFYYQEDETYEAGIIVYEPNVNYIQDYNHILNIEISPIVNNPTDVLNEIFNQYKTIILKENNNIKGFTIFNEIDFPKLNGFITKLKFKEVGEKDLKNAPKNLYSVKK